MFDNVSHNEGRVSSHYQSHLARPSWLRYLCRRASYVQIAYQVVLVYIRNIIPDERGSAIVPTDLIFLRRAPKRCPPVYTDTEAALFT